ncbi:hypothetical protein [Halorhodospira halochloris]|uniref:hypothetical protein n=1 Tax=Halorhodospira halochloris TaxID=1052 RepID=UPI00076F948C|nr:hypothetical protein [Halorhodospira halochloris]
MQTFQKYYRFEREKGKEGIWIYVTRSRVDGNGAPPGIERDVAATAILLLSQDDMLIKDLTINPSCALPDNDGVEQGELKYLHDIYSERFPMLYAAAMAAALSMAHYYGCSRVRGYLSPQEVRILPKLFPINCCGGREFYGYTAQILDRAAQRMPVFYELIVIAAEQLEGS